MARIVNATLFVSSFTSTGNDGEYTFTSATYENQADATGNGSADAKVGGILFVPATDVNTATPVPGVVHRYKITVLTVIDQSTLSGTILWDESNSAQVDEPTNGAYCLYSEPAPNNRFGLPPSEAVYPNLSAGSSLASTIVDIRDITDTLIGGLYLVGVTTSSTPITLTPKTSQPAIPNNSSAIFKISVLGRRTDVADQGCAFEFVGLVNQDSIASTTALIGSPQKTIVARSDSAWDATITSDTVNGGVSVQVTGTGSATLSWTARVNLITSTT